MRHERFVPYTLGDVQADGLVRDRSARSIKQRTVFFSQSLRPVVDYTFFFMIYASVLPFQLDSSYIDIIRPLYSSNSLTPVEYPRSCIDL